MTAIALPGLRRSRATQNIINAFRSRLSPRHWPRPGYCHCCGTWTWLTNETPAYSAYDGAYLCEDCAAENDRETAFAWAEYWQSRL